MNMHVPTLQRSLQDVVAEYDHKRARLPEEFAAFKRAGADLQMAATICGVYGDTTIDTGRPYESSLETSLLKSAWKHVYEGLNIERLASADDKRKWRMALENPPAFTLENIRGTFGHYILDPRGNILRGLAEVFCQLDPAYKSHDKVKIGVAGLPKRIIVSNVGSWGSYGRDKIISTMNALAAYQSRPLVEHTELEELDELHRWNGHRAGVVEMRYQLPTLEGAEPVFRSRGLTIKKFQNGNAHVIFDQDTLSDINKALAEFYGDVLADTTEEKPAKPAASTEVSKDLQYYPTPAKVVDSVLDNLYRIEGKLILEPSCGCGRFMDGLRKRGAIPFGVEYDARRVAEARAKGHKVMHGNFLKTVPDRRFDAVVMNPPFYGKHYAKHVEHAFKFLKPGGTLTAILPATARYDHGLVDGKWDDLPVGSFSESGTNINTSVLTMRAAS